MKKADEDEGEEEEGVERPAGPLGPLKKRNVSNKYSNSVKRIIKLESLGNRE